MKTDPTRDALLQVLRSLPSDPYTTDWRWMWAHLTGYLAGSADAPRDPELYEAMRAVRDRCIRDSERARR